MRDQTLVEHLIRSVKLPAPTGEITPAQALIWFLGNVRIQQPAQSVDRRAVQRWNRLVATEEYQAFADFVTRSLKDASTAGAFNALVLPAGTNSIHGDPRDPACLFAVLEAAGYWANAALICGAGAFFLPPALAGCPIAIATASGKSKEAAQICGCNKNNPPPPAGPGHGAARRFVGRMKVWGNVTGRDPSPPVVSTGVDPWADSPVDYAMSDQSVNSQIAKANTYGPGSGACTSNGGTFYIQTDTQGGSSSLNESSVDTWYDVKTVQEAYVGHTNGDPSSWDLSAVRTVGSVKIGAKGGLYWSQIISATDSSQGTGNAVSVDSNGIAGPFYVAPNETTANASPRESGVSLTDATCANGNTAPLTLV